MTAALSSSETGRQSSCGGNTVDVSPRIDWMMVKKRAVGHLLYVLGVSILFLVNRIFGFMLRSFPKAFLQHLLHIWTSQISAYPESPSSPNSPSFHHSLSIKPSTQKHLLPQSLTHIHRIQRCALLSSSLLSYALLPPFSPISSHLTPARPLPLHPFALFDAATLSLTIEACEIFRVCSSHHNTTQLVYQGGRDQLRRRCLFPRSQKIHLSRRPTSPSGLHSADFQIIGEGRRACPSPPNTPTPYLESLRKGRPLQEPRTYVPLSGPAG